MEQRRVLVAVSGGIAAYKVPELIRILRRAGACVRCAMTENAQQFVTPLVVQTLTGYPVRKDLFDPSQNDRFDPSQNDLFDPYQNDRFDPFQNDRFDPSQGGEIDHISLADWAELAILAPATANSLAKLRCGLADDLVSAVLLATRAPILVAPAMNVNMWEHPATRANMEVLRERGVRSIGPESGELACGWEGAGRMSPPEAIAAEASLLLGTRDLAGERILVSAGGTREPIDAVRYLGNRSSGKMGFAVAAEAARRGAEVVLVAAPTALTTPAGVRRLDVRTASEMRDAVLSEFGASSIAVMAAAVADFRPAQYSERKIKKEDLADSAGLTLELVRNPDILAELCEIKGERTLVGFAAESHDLIAAASRKLARKGCDLLVANDISEKAAVFDSDSNAAVFVWPDGQIEELPSLAKSAVAAQLLDRIVKLRKGSK